MNSLDSAAVTLVELSPVPWVNFKMERAYNDIMDVALYIWNRAQDENRSLKSIVDELIAMGAKLNYKTLHRHVKSLPEYAEVKQEKKLNPSRSAKSMRKARDVHFSHGEICEQPENLSPEPFPEIVKKVGVSNDTLKVAVEDDDAMVQEARFKPGFVGASREELIEYIRELESDLERAEADSYKMSVTSKPMQTDIAAMASYLAEIKTQPKTKAQIKREEKKRKMALVPIYADPLEMGYENARLKAENTRLRDEVERYKPVPIDTDKLGSREVKGLAQRLGLNQNLSTEETRAQVKEALTNRDNLIKARQLLGQSEGEVLRAKIAEQQELLELWQKSRQYYVGKGSFWTVLDADPRESEDTIRAKYKRLIGFWHPDRNPLPIAHEIAADINRAWTSYERNYITRKLA